ncbi:hypothetical protein GQ44DRAFT_727914 [Phaeosphaeriaceae sp. PMI808]|nr:hypothetical protein GQ44DRAFT_727914 [Phaeosphaeriaceae sp. PMI808]
MDRNSLVSVFLRVLECCKGIMFLTTNQIVQFDIAIPYDSLPLDDQGLIERYDEIVEWLEEDAYNIGFDGRQIRNTVTTALGLARADAQYNNGKGKLTRWNLKAVVNNARAFKTESIKQFERYKNSQDNMIN